MSRGIVALSSAAVLAVYSAGYLRTQAAADRLAAEADQRRPSIPAPVQPTAPPAPDAVGAAEARLDYGPTGIDPADAEPVAAPGIETQKSAARPDPADRQQPTQATPAPPAAAPATRVDVAANDSDAPGNAATTKVTTAEPDTSAAPAPAEAITVAQAEVPLAMAATTAAAPVTPDASAPAPAAPKYKDGTYTGWGTSRHGDIQAQVVIVDGRITSATIAQCMTRWPCSWIEALPPQVVQRQSPETDFVSGATQSTNAFYYGVVQALGKAALP